MLNAPHDPVCHCRLRRIVFEYMKKCYIICASDTANARPLPSEGDLVIAADAGLKNCEKLCIKPDVTVGDFDSLGYIPKGGEVIVHPVRKDDTDASLAAKTGMKRGHKCFIILGGTGGSRPDHTLANLQTLIMLAGRGCRGYMYGDGFAFAAVKNGVIRFDENNSGTLSAFCFGEDARGVFETGLSYCTDNAVLTSSFPLGVSNSFKGESAAVSVKDGTLVIYWETDYERFIETVERNEKDR